MIDISHNKIIYIYHFALLVFVLQRCYPIKLTASPWCPGKNTLKTNKRKHKPYQHKRKWDTHQRRKTFFSSFFVDPDELLSKQSVYFVSLAREKWHGISTTNHGVHCWLTTFLLQKCCITLHGNRDIIVIVSELTTIQ